MHLGPQGAHEALVQSEPEHCPVTPRSRNATLGRDRARLLDLVRQAALGAGPTTVVRLG